jgi:hypothetical protein
MYSWRMYEWWDYIYFNYVLECERLVSHVPVFYFIPWFLRGQFMFPPANSKHQNFYLPISDFWKNDINILVLKKWQILTSLMRFAWFERVSFGWIINTGFCAFTIHLSPHGVQIGLIFILIQKIKYK